MHDHWVGYIIVKTTEMVRIAIVSCFILRHPMARKGAQADTLLIRPTLVDPSKRRRREEVGADNIPSCPGSGNV